MSSTIRLLQTYPAALGFSTPRCCVQLTHLQKIMVVSVKAPPIVLVIENNAELNRFISQALDEKYQVISAFDELQGLQMAASANPMLIISSIKLADMHSGEIVMEIRKLADLTHVPILLITSQEDENLKTELLNAGAQDFLGSPFTKIDLLVRVKNLLNLKESQQRYQTFYTSMDQGFCTIEMIFDEHENPLD